MKQKPFLKIIIVLFLAAVQYQSKAQSPVQSNVFFEALGPGGVFSVNYEARFSSDPNYPGLGIRAGLSYTQISPVSLFTVPVQVNYLFGHDEKYFEVGGGATYATASFTDISDSNNSASGGTVIGTLTFGYRKQPVDGGFMFRAGVSPVFGKGFFYGYWPYVSVGYSF